MTLTLILALAGCGEAGVTLEELESFPASPSASAAAPSPTDSASGTLAIDGLAEVLVSAVVVRTATGRDPATSAILGDRLTAGDRVFLVDGPVDDGGYAWYLVAPLFRADSVGPFGWIAAADQDGEPWIRPIQPACPRVASLAAVLALQPLERLVCFRNDTLTLSSEHVACGIASGPWVGEPDWIAGLSGCGLAIGDDVLSVRTRPGGRDIASSLPGPVTVRGHFDDPAAATCTITSAEPELPAPPREHAVLMCRSQFVSED